MLYHVLHNQLASLSSSFSSRVRNLSNVSKSIPSTSSLSLRPQYIDDEYNETKTHGSATSGVYRLSKTLNLEKGETLVNPQVAYTTYGTLNAARDNVILLCHALTGHSLAHQYWGAMVASDWLNKYFIICSNILGSCYGTTGPVSINPSSGTKYGPDFPAITLRDAVTLQRYLLEEEFHVHQVQTVIGGSLGGMQALEWAFQSQETNYIKSFVTIACNAQHSAWQIAMSELQRQAIYMDPKFCNGHYYTSSALPDTGLALARQIAMISYRTHAAYAEKFGRREEEYAADKNTRLSKHGRYVVQSYLNYQGDKFLSRFDANSYLTLLHMMDTHDVGRGRGGVNKALSSLSQPALVIGFDSDILYPLCEQQQLADGLPNAQFATLSSVHGHDGVLLAQEEISELTKRFLAEYVE